MVASHICVCKETTCLSTRQLSLHLRILHHMAEAFCEVNTSQLSRFGAIPKIFTSQYVLPLNATRLILNKIVIFSHEFEVFDFEGNRKTFFHNISTIRCQLIEESNVTLAVLLEKQASVYMVKYTMPEYS